MPQGWTVPREKMMRLSCRLRVKLLWPGLIKWQATGLSESLCFTERKSISELPACPFHWCKAIGICCRRCSK